MRRNHKDILLGLVATLSDNECKDIYYLIQDYKTPVINMIEFDRVKLSQGQYNKLIWYWGKEKTDECIKILNEWLIKKGIKHNISHYKNIIGWVERAYYRTHPISNKELRFDSNIDTASKAKAYINKIPEELRAYDSEVKYLVERFGTKVLC